MCYSAMIRQRSREFEVAFQTRIQEDAWESFYRFREKYPGSYKQENKDGRIFPFYFAPIIVWENGGRVLKPMRYQVFPSSPTFQSDPKHLSLFNARRDNLTKKHGVWNGMFGKRHGLLVLHKFFEWVQVRDLVKSGVISLFEVQDFFEKQEEKKQLEFSIAGKAYRRSKIASLPAIERRIEVTFTPKKHFDLCSPVLWDLREDEHGFLLHSFAIITDIPPPEISAAGHDRCPVFLQEEAWNSWLQPQEKSQFFLDSLLDRTETDFYDVAIS